MRGDLDEVLRLARRLDKSELILLQTHIKGLISVTAFAEPEAAPITPADPDIDWLLEGLYHTLRTIGLLGENERLPPDALRAAAPNFAAKSARVRKLLTSRARGAKMGMPELMVLGRTCGEALVDLIEGWKDVPLGVATLLRIVDRVPEALEASFPGYLGAGMIKVLIRTA